MLEREAAVCAVLAATERLEGEEKLDVQIEVGEGLLGLGVCVETAAWIDLPTAAASSSVRQIGDSGSFGAAGAFACDAKAVKREIAKKRAKNRRVMGWRAPPKKNDRPCTKRPDSPEVPQQSVDWLLSSGRPLPQICFGHELNPKTPHSPCSPFRGNPILALDHDAKSIARVGFAKLCACRSELGPNHDCMFQVPSFQAPIVWKPDVCVIGGGAAGVSAAVAAGRLGLDVLLVEKYGFCGGAAVAGLSGTICGLHSSGDAPKQIVFGFAGEFYNALRARGGAGEALPFGRTQFIPQDSFVWKETADHFLQSAGVRILFHTAFLDVFPSDGGAAQTVLLHCLEGIVAVQPKTLVDASGDAHVIHRFHGETTLGKNGVVQTPTMIFRMGNVDMPRALQLDPRELHAKVADAHRSGRYRLPRHHVYMHPMPNGREFLCNMTRITLPDGSVPMGICSSDMSFAEMEGRAQARSYERFLRENIAGFEHAYLIETGTQVGIRQSRSIVGKQRLTNEAVLSAAKTPGAATFSAWPIENHGTGELKIAFLEDDTYDIPFETLIPAMGSNLLVAGRCLSADHEALASARVTAQCFGMGYAVGAACGLMVREHASSQDLTGTDVADWMKTHGLKTAAER
ncbi:MAG: hypothetical protein RLZZ142_948 [Verrucomicrobiota bacterium]